MFVMDERRDVGHKHINRDFSLRSNMCRSKAILQILQDKQEKGHFSSSV